MTTEGKGKSCPLLIIGLTLKLKEVKPQLFSQCNVQVNLHCGTLKLLADVQNTLEYDPSCSHSAALGTLLSCSVLLLISDTDAQITSSVRNVYY